MNSVSKISRITYSAILWKKMEMHYIYIKMLSYLEIVAIIINISSVIFGIKVTNSIFVHVHLCVFMYVHM